MALCTRCYGNGFLFTTCQERCIDHMLTCKSLSFFLNLNSRPNVSLFINRKDGAIAADKLCRPHLNSAIHLPPTKTTSGPLLSTPLLPRKCAINYLRSVINHSPVLPKDPRQPGTARRSVGALWFWSDGDAITYSPHMVNDSNKSRRAGETLHLIPNQS